MKLCIGLIVMAILFFMMSSVQADALQDLIDSYSFDYDGGEISGVSVVDSLIGGILVFNVSVVSAVSGDYLFYVDVEDDEGVVSGEVVGVFGSSGGDVEVEVEGYLLSGKDWFNYSLRVYDGDGVLVYRQGGFVTGNYSYDLGFGVLSVVSGECVSGECIWLNVSIESSVAVVENVSVFLEYLDEVIVIIDEVSFVVGVNDFELRIDGEVLGETHYDGVFNISKVLIGERLIGVDYVTGFYSYGDFFESSYLDSCDVKGVDLDLDNLFEYLKFDFGVVALEAGNYRVEADVYGDEDRYLVSLSESVIFLSPRDDSSEPDDGGWNISAKINGSLFYSLGADGPYFVRNVLLFFNDVEVDFLGECFVGGGFSYLDFERAALPDLVVGLVGGEDLINVSVENIGGTLAFGFGVEVFDSFNFSKSWFIDSLDAGEVQVFSFDVSDVGSEVFVGVVDFDNLVGEENESNNVWTLNLSVCVEDVINGSWGEWVNVSKCRVNGSLVQNRSRVEFDSSFCGEVVNVTYFEFREIECLYDDGAFEECLGVCRGDWREGRKVCRNDRVVDSRECRGERAECFDECKGGSWRGKWSCSRGCFWESVECRRDVFYEYWDCAGEARGERRECRANCFEEFGLR